MAVTEVEIATRPARDRADERLAGRLGLSVPHEWWSSPALLEAYRAAGFAWVQLHAPPPSVLSDPRHCVRHGAAAAAALSASGLRSVVHAPSGLRAGDRGGDQAFEGLLSYAAEVGAEQIVYHALAFEESPGSNPAVAAEARSLAALAAVAERLRVTIAIENLAPLYPGPETISANPLVLRSLALRIGSERVALCLDVGHAHVIADRRRMRAEALCEPVLDHVSLIHAHDNFGARRRPTGAELGVDPLRLDLHLAPGRGTLDWGRIAPTLRTSHAPVVLEVHPPHRPRAEELAAGIRGLLS